MDNLDKVLIFVLDDEEYAVPLTSLKEVIPVMEQTPVPDAPEYISGIINLRGKVIVVVDLEKKFALLRENKASFNNIIITEVEGNDFGVLVDRVKEIIELPKDSVKPVPEMVTAKINAQYLNGVVVLENEKSRVIMLLDLPKLLKVEEVKKYEN